MEDFEELVGFAMGELDPARAADMQARLEATPALAARLAQVQRFLASLPADEEPAGAPEWLLSRVKAAFTGHSPPRPADSPQPLAALRQMLARIIFDSRAQVAIGGFRGGIGAYHLSLSSEVAEVDLQVAPAAARKDRWDILGQIERGQIEPGQVEPAPAAALASIVARSAQSVAHTSTDEHGLFRLELAAGTYDVRIVLDDAEVALPPLEVG